MKALVTGGCGFIGSHLVDALLEDGHEVVVVDDLSTGNHNNLSKEAAFMGSLETADSIFSSPGGQGSCDCVFHLAAYPSVPGSVLDPWRTHKNGCHLTSQVLDMARRIGVRRFVFASSCAVYAQEGALTKSETDRLAPLSPYAASKAAGEMLAMAYASCYDMDCVSLRFFNVYGPRQAAHSSYSGVISRFCALANAGRPLEVHGTGEQSRDFVYVADVVRACLLAGKSATRFGGMAINVGTGISESVLELAGAFGGPIVHTPSRPGDIRAIQANTERASELLGFRAETDLVEGIRRTMEWHKAAAS